MHVTRLNQLIWRIALLTLGVWLALTVFRSPTAAGWGAVGLLLLATVRPAATLLMVAAFVPLEAAIAALAAATVPVGELLVLSWLGGVALWRGLGREWKPIVPGAVPLLALAILASYGVTLMGCRERLGPDTFADQLQLLATGRYFAPEFVLGNRAAFGALQGLGLVAATVTILHHSSQHAIRLIRMLVAGATAIGILNIARLMTAAIGTERPIERVSALVREIRIDTHFGDVNAAGSYFALMFFCAIGVWLSSRRGRPLASIATLCIAVALALTASRAAMLAAVVAACAAAAAFAGLRKVVPLQRHRPAIITGVIVAGAAGLCLVFLVLPNTLLGRGVGVAAVVRRDMAIVSFRLFEQAPVFGIGVGQFYAASESVMTDLPVREFYVRENAHNQFLQVLAELGMVGFALFVSVLVSVFVRAWRAIRSGDAGAEMSLTLVGVAAFLISCLLGHSLLVAPVAHAFWIALGSIARGDVPLRKTDATVRIRLLVVVAIVLLASWPARVKQHVARMNLEHIGHGLSRWHTDESGVRYRIAAGRATVFVPTNVSAVVIPILVESQHDVTEVSISVDGEFVNRIQVRPGDWTRQQLLPRGEPHRQFVPVTLQVEDGDAMLRVGKVEPIR